MLSRITQLINGVLQAELQGVAPLREQDVIDLIG